MASSCPAWTHPTWRASAARLRLLPTAQSCPCELCWATPARPGLKLECKETNQREGSWPLGEDKCGPWHLGAERVAGDERGGWYTFDDSTRERKLLFSRFFFVYSPFLLRCSKTRSLITCCPLSDVPLGAAVKKKKKSVASRGSAFGSC